MGFIGSSIYLILGFALTIILVGALLLMSVPFVLPVCFMWRAYGGFDIFMMIGQCPKCNSELRYNIRRNKPRNWQSQGLNCPGCASRIVVKPPYFWLPPPNGASEGESLCGNKLQ